MATESVVMSNVQRPKQSTWFLPREHGATAMLFTPIVCAAILSRSWRWAELATLIAAFAALAAKDPMVVLARQHFVWKQWHPETSAAIRWFAGWSILLCLSGLVLLFAWPFTATAVPRSRRRHLFRAGHRHQRQEPPALHSLPNRQRLRSYIQLPGHFALRHRSHRSLVLGFVASACLAGHRRESSSSMPVSTPASPCAPPRPPAKIIAAPHKSRLLFWSARRWQPSSSIAALSHSHLCWPLSATPTISIANATSKPCNSRSSP